MASEWSDNIVIAKLSDEPALSEELSGVIQKVENASDPLHVVFDFGDVSYINSSNIAQLLRVHKHVADAGRSMRLCGLADEVWSVMLVTGLDKVFKFAPDTMTALAGLQLEDGDGSA